MRKVLYAWTWWLVGIACVLVGLYLYSRRVFSSHDSADGS